MVAAARETAAPHEAGIIRFAAAIPRGSANLPRSSVCPVYQIAKLLASRLLTKS